MRPAMGGGKQERKLEDWFCSLEIPVVGRLFSPFLWFCGCLSGSREQKEATIDTGLSAKAGGGLTKHSPSWNLHRAWDSLTVVWLHGATAASVTCLELWVTSLAFG